MLYRESSVDDASLHKGVVRGVCGAAEERGEGIDECNEVFDARLELCDALEDAVHEPEFGPEFAGNFVNPLLIGNGVAPNPYLPLVQGNQWVYEGGGEIVTVTVLDKTKLIDGVTCRVVNDVVEGARSSAEKRGLELNAFMAEDVPSLLRSDPGVGQRIQRRPPTVGDSTNGRGRRASDYQSPRPSSFSAFPVSRIAAYTR